MTRTDPNRVNPARRGLMAQRRAMHVPYDVPVRPTDKVWYWVGRGTVFNPITRRRSFYWPHQGKREAERALRQAARIRARRLVRQLITVHAPLSAELLTEANVKRPAGYRQFDLNGDFWRFAP